MWKWLKYQWFKFVEVPRMEAELDEEVQLYGADNTIHKNQWIDIETDPSGKVVAAWFRCATLPFKQFKVGEDRADQMRTLYQQENGSVYPKIISMDFIQPSDERKL